jgi:hypothetical protein
MKKAKVHQITWQLEGELNPRACVVMSVAHYEALRRSALGVANALHVGTGAMIRGTMMEDDLRKALELKPGELWNFTTGKAEPSHFGKSQEASPK